MKIYSLKKNNQVSANSGIFLPNGVNSKGKRNNFMGGFVGINRTGKSVVANQYAKDWKASKPDYYKVLAYDPQDRFADVADYFLYADDPDFENHFLNLRNGLLILDDYKSYYLKNTHTDALVTLMQFKNKWNIDIIYITHNPALILNLFTYYTTHYFVFRTESKEGSFQAKIPNYHLCHAAALEINEYTRIYGRGEYPGPFPHIVVDTDNQRLTAEGMSNFNDFIKQK